MSVLAERRSESFQARELPRRASGWGANLALAVASALVFVTIAECLCRLAGFQRRGSWSAPCYRPDPDVGHLFSPGFQGSMYKGIASGWQEVPLRINAHGLRGPEFPIAKPEGVRRVLVLGDSFAFGYLLPEEESLPALLQAELDRGRTPGAVQVINAGIPGYGVRNERRYLEHRGFDLQPDVVVLVASPGDVADAGVRADQAEAGGRVSLSSELRLYRLVQSSSFALFLQYAGFEILDRINPALALRSGFNAERMSVGIRQAWGRYTAEFVRIASLTRDRGVPLLLVVYPGEIELYADRDTVQHRWQQLAARRDVPIVELLPLFKAARSRGLYLPADGHPTGAANALVARELANRLPPP